MDASLLATQLHFEAAVGISNGRRRGLLASEVIDELVIWLKQLEQSAS